ncbi:hypothetical protein KNZ07_10300 [Streptococcus dysgalactiae subsp. equisimilis]|nr:hypothetical protein KNZ01_05980 [Streptococcus dysgalactiae subsp. equisimilis]GET76537.1 hypothetical protein KNZ07_10300 [Streptococcus dysgalactiae subsp. equisimilis]GET77993.1 hypothetical protein KNZ10_05640 [Streptococcus dysgalactiae subsp. equisimilis]GET79458.1 hypothetical protein KNZ12_00990 [Streptococcus dysgalactiae subsp. equisimilis]GET81443.1 hypothetical protein KNZ15_01420 [Streptococcus dysgalactiae subsp. equisimilis]
MFDGCQVLSRLSEIGRLKIKDRIIMVRHCWIYPMDKVFIKAGEKMSRTIVEGLYENL